MLETMRELGFIPESRVLRIFTDGDEVFGERYDRVTLLRERLKISMIMDDRNEVFVEARKFLPLITFIRQAIVYDDYLFVELNNGAEYKLPYMEYEFHDIFNQDYFSDAQAIMRGTFDFSALKKTVLPNLVKPEMRCIYVDEHSAVSCNFLQGTVDKRFTSIHPILISPDMFSYMPLNVDGVIYEKEGFLLFKSATDEQYVLAPKNEFESLEDDEPWYVTIRNQSESVEDSAFVNIPITMLDSLHRLSSFGDVVTFKEHNAWVGEDWEPFILTSDRNRSFKIEEITSVMDGMEKISFGEQMLIAKKGDLTVIVSEEE